MAIQLELFPKINLKDSKASAEGCGVKVAEVVKEDGTRGEERNKEIQRLKNILALPTETLLDQGITEEDLVLIQQNLTKIQNWSKTIEQYNRDNKLFLFSPNLPQLDFIINYLNPQYRVFTYTGGNRRGKTSIMVILSICEMVGYFPFTLQSVDRLGKVQKSWEEVYEEIKQWEGETWKAKWIKGKPFVEFIFSHNEPRRIRYIGQGWEDHVKEVVVPEFHKWWPLSRELKIKKNILGIEAWWIDAETNSEVRIMSNDQPVRKFEGWNGTSIKYDEPCKRDVRIANARGLVDKDGSECFAMTLLSEAWIDREIIKKRLKDGKPDPSVYNNHGTIYDNVGYGLRDKKSVETFASKLKEEEKSARIDGVPSYLSGLVFSRFDRAVHLVKRFPIPVDWPVDIAIDFHPKTEQAVLFQATDRQGYKYLVDEIWEHANYEELGNEILRRIKFRGYRVGRIIIDPSTKGQGENVAVEKSVFEKFSDFFFRFGYILEAGSKRRTDGIILCKERLHGLNKQASVKVLDDLVRFIWEIEGWMYSEKTQKPVDADDHLLESWGRLELLDTKYTPPEVDLVETNYPRDFYRPGVFSDSYSNFNYQGTNSITGY